MLVNEIADAAGSSGLEEAREALAFMKLLASFVGGGFALTGVILRWVWTQSSRHDLADKDRGRLWEENKERKKEISARKEAQEKDKDALNTRMDGFSESLAGIGTAVAVLTAVAERIEKAVDKLEKKN